MLWKDLSHAFDHIIYNFMKKRDRKSDFVVDIGHTERFRIPLVSPQRAHLAACLILIRGSADRSLTRPGRKEANVSVRVAGISFGALPLQEKQLDDSSRLDVVEIARVPDMLPSLSPSWSG